MSSTLEGDPKQVAGGDFDVRFTPSALAHGATPELRNTHYRLPITGSRDDFLPNRSVSEVGSVHDLPATSLYYNDSASLIQASIPEAYCYYQEDAQNLETALSFLEADTGLNPRPPPLPPKDKLSFKRQPSLAAPVELAGSRSGTSGASLPGPPATARRREKAPDHDTVQRLRAICTNADPAQLYHNFVKLSQHNRSGKIYTADQLGTNLTVAIRALHICRHPNRILNEILIMRSLRRPNIVNYIGSFLHKDTAWVIMEYMGGGSLTDIITTNLMTEGQIAAVSREIAQGLEHLHCHGITHRDIKSDNVLLSLQGDIKIANFQFCAQFSGLARLKGGALIGAPGSMVPEVVMREEYGPEADIWSLGIVTIEMIECEALYLGNLPFRIQSLIATNRAATLANSEGLSPVFQDYLAKTLEVDTKKRPDAAQLLAHPFFRKAERLRTLSPLIKAAREAKKRK
ncbi:signal transducing kinase of the PAK [Ceratobasidium sp. UAMH 11750]|nr:signal transducing kinase of the PAK [Ceratobasidium sp. UAMH 11750]